MYKSTPKQRQDIGFLRKLLGLDEETYREILSTYNAESSKNLTRTQAYELIDRLRNNAKQTGVFKSKKAYSFQKYKYDNLGSRDGMASPAQLRKIEAMWLKISRQKTDSDRAKALDVLIKRVTNKSDIKFLTALDVRKMIKALENM